MERIVARHWWESHIYNGKGCGLVRLMKMCIKKALMIVREGERVLYSSVLNHNQLRKAYGSCRCWERNFQTWVPQWCNSPLIVINGSALYLEIKYLAAVSEPNLTARCNNVHSLNDSSTLNLRSQIKKSISRRVLECPKTQKTDCEIISFVAEWLVTKCQANSRFPTWSALERLGPRFSTTPTWLINDSNSGMVVLAWIKPSILIGVQQLRKIFKLVAMEIKGWVSQSWNDRKGDSWNGEGREWEIA